jgi:metal-sulfur cluster biosynthetic enzyme
MATQANDIDEAITQALDRVYDPCSVGINRPMSLREMGLIRGWDVDDDGRVTVRMCVTAPVCQMAPHMTEAVREELERIPGVASAQAHIDHHVLWTPEMMSPAGRDKLASQRAAAERAAGPVPRRARRPKPAQAEAPDAR